MTVFAIVLGIVYLLVGIPKLTGAKPLADQFEEFGLGKNLMRAVGALEIAAAVGLQFNGLNTLAAAGMCAMMLGALYHHRRAGHPGRDMVPGAVVLVASAAFVVLSV